MDIAHVAVMSPPPKFCFSLTEMTHCKDVVLQLDHAGKWMPSAKPSANVPLEGWPTRWWYCNSDHIEPYHARVPSGSKHYKTFSTFYSDGSGFWIMEGDAARPKGQTWHHLWFDFNENDLSSSLTNVNGDKSYAALYHRTGIKWVPMLFPSIYYSRRQAPEVGRGGLSGELPILLSLLALSMERATFYQHVQNIMQNGQWQTHDEPNGWLDKRGVIVSVYTVDGNADQLDQYEQGIPPYGKYFN